MTREQAERLVIDALALAMARDGSSGEHSRPCLAIVQPQHWLTWVPSCATGGLARLVTISKDGSQRRLVKGNDVPLMWDDIEPGNGNGNGIVIL